MSGAEDLPRSPAGGFNPWMIAGLVSIAPFMEVLDTTIANVALTHIAGSLAASQDESTWVLTSYLVSNTIILPISGWLANVLGRKRFYLICVALFTVSSVACALSTTLPMMLIARVFQGLGGGGLAPVTQAMLADSFPSSKRSQAFAVFGLTIIAAPAVGPILGGYLTDNLSWHWIFLINLPIGLIAFTLISTFISEPTLLIKERKELLKGGLHFDYFGLFLVALGFGTLQVFLDKFQEDEGFSSPFILTCFVVTAVSLALLAVWEWEHPYPVMNLRLFKYRNFAIGSVLLFFVGFVLLSSTQLLPQLTQTLIGYDSTTSGLVLALGGFATIGLMPVAGIITGRLVPAKALLFFGFMEIGFALLLQSSIVPDVSFGTLSFFRVLQVMAMPFVFIPVNSLAYVGIPPRNNGEASALINQCRNLGSSVGISFVTTLLAWRTQFHHARLAEPITPYSSLHHLTVSQITPILQVQASFLSYLDIFRIVGFIAFVICPLAIMFKMQSKRATEGAPVGH